ncbi:transposase [Roseovarius amoyensis]|uniref:transposase n=1 Tax=Roseovarius amoyensis TaxID=2211448 RepID=UPI000DBE7E5E|nr:transposase [Roseovarius amoyensis]
MGPLQTSPRPRPPWPSWLPATATPRRNWPRGSRRTSPRALPSHPARARLRTSNPMERSVQQELKRRTVKVRVFPSEDALLRLVSAVLVEIDDKWAAETKPYIKWECQDA